jgi:C4-dicarboxylate transporter DctM subunit
MTGMDVVLLLFGIFLVLCFLTIPIGISIGLSVLAYVFFIGGINMTFIASSMFQACDSFPLMAIPFFILAGALMEGGGLSKRLVDFCDTLVGHLTGGLAIVTVLTSMFFGAISGSAPATVAAIGTIMVPSMIARGYEKKFSLALVAASGCLGTIIPPSIPMVMYGVATGASISKMFMGGFLPGIVCGLALIIVAMFYSKRNGFVGNGLKFSFARVWKEFKKAIWALMVPVIILGGIYGGFFTPTEAAVVAVIYGLIAGAFIYKELDFKRVAQKFVEASVTTGSILIIVGTGMTFGRVLALEQAPVIIAKALNEITNNRVTMMLLINCILLITGCFIETTCANLILAPILYPIAAAYGVNIIHFGVMMVINLSIGFITPPLGVNLFVACGIGKVPFTDVVRKILPFLIVLIAALAIITYVPNVVLLLPNLFVK